MGRFTLRLDEAAGVFGRNNDLGIKLQERDARIVDAVRMAVNRVFHAAADSKCYAVEDGSRLLEVRRGRLSGGVMERSLTKLRGSLDGERDPEPRESPFSGYLLPILLHLLQYGISILKGHVVAQTYDFERLSNLTRAYSLLSKRVRFFQGGGYRFECSTA